MRQYMGTFTMAATVIDDFTPWPAVMYDLADLLFEEIETPFTCCWD